MKIVELKRQMDARFDAVDARFEAVDARFTRVDARFDDIEQQMAAEHASTRHHMDVLIEQVKAEYRLGLDRMVSIERRLANSIASNAVDHTTFEAALQQHEVRITALEAGDESSEPPSSS